MALDAELKVLIAQARVLTRPYTWDSYRAAGELAKQIRTKGKWVDSDDGKLFTREQSPDDAVAFLSTASRAPEHAQI